MGRDQGWNEGESRESQAVDSPATCSAHPPVWTKRSGVPPDTALLTLLGPGGTGGLERASQWQCCAPGTLGAWETAPSIPRGLWPSEELQSASARAGPAPCLPRLRRRDWPGRLWSPPRSQGGCGVRTHRTARRPPSSELSGLGLWISRCVQDPGSPQPGSLTSCRGAQQEWGEASHCLGKMESSTSVQGSSSGSEGQAAQEAPAGSALQTLPREGWVAVGPAGSRQPHPLGPAEPHALSSVT